MLCLKVKCKEGELNYREMQENVESWKRGNGGGEGRGMIATQGEREEQGGGGERVEMAIITEA